MGYRVHDPVWVQQARLIIGKMIEYRITGAGIMQPFRTDAADPAEEALYGLTEVTVCVTFRFRGHRAVDICLRRTGAGNSPADWKLYRVDYPSGEIGRPDVVHEKAEWLYSEFVELCGMDVRELDCVLVSTTVTPWTNGPFSPECYRSVKRYRFHNGTETEVRETYRRNDGQVERWWRTREGVECWVSACDPRELDCAAEVK